MRHILCIRVRPFFREYPSFLASITEQFDDIKTGEALVKSRDVHSSAMPCNDRSKKDTRDTAKSDTTTELDCVANRSVHLNGAEKEPGISAETAAEKRSHGTYSTDDKPSATVDLPSRSRAPLRTV